MWTYKNSEIVSQASYRVTLVLSRNRASLVDIKNHSVSSRGLMLLE